MKKLTTLTGPSCAGKSTLEKMMVDRGCMKAVSSTTRTPRAGETDGVDYYFMSKDKFLLMATEGMFIEVVRFGDQHYGVSVAEIERLFMNGDHVVLVCEPNGAEQIQKWARARPDIQLTSVFVDNPTSVISDRFLRRFHQDVQATMGDYDPQVTEKVYAAYAKRMAMMVNTEPTWRIPAYSPAPGRLAYDLVFESFDSTNDDRIANILCEVPVLTV
jgi:guanylate kinase